MIDLNKEEFGDDIYDRSPLLLVGDVLAAIKTSEDWGSESNIGNYPAIGQKEIKGKLSRKKAGVFYKIRSVETKRKLSTSIKNNGYAQLHIPFSIASSNAIIEVFRILAKPERNAA